MATVPNQLALSSGERRADPSNSVYGVIALGVSVSVLLGALMGAWLALRSGTLVWPPKGVKVENYYGSTLSVTMLLSGVAGWWALYGVRRGERGQAAVALGLVIFLDGAFINLLTYVIRGAHFGPSTSPYGVVYYAINTAVIAVAATGILVAAVGLARVIGGQVSPSEPQLGWAAAWYGTAVAVAWFVMYVAVYVTH
ncbi:MAG: hypothetical protein NVS3B12_21260 [Acidimicrobiales bacterium]